MTQVSTTCRRCPDPLRVVFVLSAATLTVCAALAIAASHTPAGAYPSAVRKACKWDYKRICPRYKVGTARMRNCMASNVGQISARCYRKLIDYGYGNRKRGRSRRRR